MFQAQQKTISEPVKARQGNELFPVFLKLEELNTLVVGGGNVAFEKLRALVNNSPTAQIRVVAAEVKIELEEFLQENPQVEVSRRWFVGSDLQDVDLLLVAIDDHEQSEEIVTLARSKGILVNVADKPDLCDFYLSSIVKKGQVKIAISTNGYSPTLAKRLKNVFEELIPEEIDETAENLQRIRQGLNGSFREKVLKLNEITAALAVEPDRFQRFKLRNIAVWALAVIGLMTAGHLLFSLIPVGVIGSATVDALSQLDQTFLYVVIGGFAAQLIDGCLSMAYGVSANTVLLSIGVPPAAASASVHISEIFTSGVSGLMHLRFGNVNNKLFKTLLLPGIAGAIVGAFLLATMEAQLSWIKPIVAVYTAILGVLIIRKVFRKVNKRKPVKRVGWLATAGGFLDAIGGGGWGPIVASTLIARGKHPKYTVGSVCVAEFFVSLASSITFISLIGLDHWSVIFGLILGGLIAAPIAAKLSSRVPVKTLMLIVGVVVIILSLRTLLKTSGLL